MAATRLRRTFQYPSESDDEDAVEEGMDEQDQENLISTLSSKDTSSTHTYTVLLLILPLAPILLYIPRIFNFSTTTSSIVAIGSLLASAYALYFLPLPPVRVNVINIAELDGSSGSTKGKGKAIARGTDGTKAAAPTAERRSVPYISEDVAEALAKWIVPANGALCVLLAVLEFLRGREEWSEGLMIGGGYMPGLILTVVLWARRELRVVDLGELEKLRYRTKGS